MSDIITETSGSILRVSSIAPPRKRDDIRHVHHSGGSAERAAQDDQFVRAWHAREIRSAQAQTWQTSEEPLRGQATVRNPVYQYDRKSRLSPLCRMPWGRNDHVDALRLRVRREARSTCLHQSRARAGIGSNYSIPAPDWTFRGGAASVGLPSTRCGLWSSDL